MNIEFVEDLNFDLLHIFLSVEEGYKCGKFSAEDSNALQDFYHELYGMFNYYSTEYMMSFYKSKISVNDRIDKVLDFMKNLKSVQNNLHELKETRKKFISGFDEKVGWFKKFAEDKLNIIFNKKVKVYIGLYWATWTGFSEVKSDHIYISYMGDIEKYDNDLETYYVTFIHEILHQYLGYSDEAHSYIILIADNYAHYRIENPNMYLDEFKNKEIIYNFERVDNLLQTNKIKLIEFLENRKFIPNFQ